MSKVINITAGVSTIGNTVNADIAISSLTDAAKLDSLKTLENGIWKSYTKGTPAGFQGFNDLTRGLGYVVNANADAAINLTGDDYKPSDSTVPTGLNMMAFPFASRTIGAGFIPRYEVGSLKNIVGGVWKSWTKGATEAFQGFTTVNDQDGYVVDINANYGTLLFNADQNRSEGIRFNVSTATIVAGTASNGILLTDPNAVGDISLDSKTVDPTVPATIMFYSIGGNIAKVDYAVEYEGEDFYITNGGVTYKGNFAENEDYSAPTALTEVVDLSGLEVSYTAKTFDATAVFKEMSLTVNGIHGIIEFAGEYIGDTFEVWDATTGTIKTGTFAEGNVNIA